MKTKLTATLVKNLPIPVRKEVYRDTEVIGFGVEIRASGEATYWFYGQIDGRLRQLRIGRVQDLTFEQAKQEAKRLRSEITLGRDPYAERVQKRAVPLYAELARQHLEHAKTYQRRPEGTEVILRRLTKQFGKQRINEITPQAIEKYLATLREALAMSTVEKIRVTLHRSFALAEKWGLPGSERNPLKAVARPRFENKRERYLTGEEATKLLKACSESSNAVLLPIVHLLLLTGARKRELLDARWEHVSIERRAWHIPDSKTGKARYVPLSQAALDVIAGLPRHPGCPWLVPNPDTLQPFDNIKNGFATARKAAGLDGLRIHDLRHSAASFMVNSGVDLYAVGRVLGHADHQSTMRYAHLANDTLLAAVEAGAAKLAG
ncbi:tyrosine-type recombinase/integrase [Novosphingobium colocasiae]|uniref:tyrosine-type recombinase/integrase n=1 Tax=Novosphingobium colocasiae TaxID=1256513 RepID=UPI0035AF9DC8